MNSYSIDKALKNIFEFLSLVNTFVDNQAPWSLKKTDPVRMEVVLYVVAILIIKSSILLLPIIPSSIKKVLSIFSLSVEEINLSKIQNFLPEIISIKKPYPIFPRIEK